MTFLLGLDIGSSFVKAALLDAETGTCVAHASSPEKELDIRCPQPGWAEQDPETWWEQVQAAVAQLRRKRGFRSHAVAAIGISYQMHGLVLLGADGLPLRPAILWCDGRAVDIGRNAETALGTETCAARLLNSPGNFTAAKLGWVAAHEPEVLARATRFLLPGDYIACRMTGEAVSTASGLSEGTLWDFQQEGPASFLLEQLGVPARLLPPLVPTFGPQGALSTEAAQALGLVAGTPLTYRAGDQPNNAWSLGVLEPGSLAATAGTSGVLYGVTDQAVVDPLQRVNTFLHVTALPEHPRLGVLLCLNGCGILQAWTRRLFGFRDYRTMNALAELAPIGSRGLRVYPFGNGSERILGLADPGASFQGIDFRIHGTSEVCRAVQEGIAFALRHGMEALETCGLRPVAIRASLGNLFLSPVFRQTLSSVTGLPVEIVDTSGAMGAARGAGLGAGFYGSPEEAFQGLQVRERINPDHGVVVGNAYQQWTRGLRSAIEQGARA